MTTDREDEEKTLTAPQLQTLKDLHMKIKGTYMQLSALLDALDILRRK
jgi:hypothetical protein